MRLLFLFKFIRWPVCIPEYKLHAMCHGAGKMGQVWAG